MMEKIGKLFKEHYESIIDSVKGKKCPNCKEGRLSIISGDGTKECVGCGYKEAKNG